MMRFETSQNLKMSQQMKLAPRMIQSMEILQLPMLALQERISQELEENIALEQVETGPEEAGEEGRATEEEGDPQEDLLDRKPLTVGDEKTGGTDDWQRLSVMESSYNEGAENEYSSSTFTPARSTGERDKKLDAMANVAARAESLPDQLLHQWSFAEVDPQVAAVGARIITYINDDGLLSADLATIYEQNRDVPGFAISPELLERALRAVQQWLEPAGLAARDNRESFLLQIDALENAEVEEVQEQEDQNWEDVRLLIREHYEDLLQNRLPKISQKANMAMERINAAMELMKKLKVNPGRELVEVEVPPITPDVMVEYDEQADGYVAALTDGQLPTLRVSPKYEAMAKDKGVETATRDFVRNNVQNAQWLIESINQRKNTLLRVVNVVLARQREYFDYGPQFLKPMPMVEVADQLGIHVATVSRAVSDKWIQTPRGMVSLRKFFSGGTESESGRNFSWEAVKAALKEIVEAEERSKPLSDDALASELKKRLGVDIARRTVVKYRQQLNIPPARRRKVH